MLIAAGSRTGRAPSAQGGVNSLGLRLLLELKKGDPDLALCKEPDSLYRIENPNCSCMD
uniref:Uncharacterized protein n=1 Tax=Arundo donax TaxID=35708 RepID=A0A0A9UB99_ARUDO